MLLRNAMLMQRGSGGAYALAMGRAPQAYVRTFAVFRMCEPFHYRDSTDPADLDPESAEDFWTVDQVDREVTRAEARHGRMLTQNGLDIRRGKDDRNVKPTDLRRITRDNYAYGDEKRKRIKVLNFCLSQRIRERELIPEALGLNQAKEMAQLEADKAFVMRALRKELKRANKA